MQEQDLTVTESDNEKHFARFKSRCGFFANEKGNLLDHFGDVYFL
jgi:hypothetical protein